MQKRFAVGIPLDDLITTPSQLKKALKRNNGKYFMINVRFREHSHDAQSTQFNAFKATSGPNGEPEVMVEPEAVPFHDPLDTVGVYSARTIICQGAWR
jgi:hypothetical protein